MDDWSPLWSFLGAAVPVGIGMALVKNYLPSYMNEKGKNLATKEDVGAITKAVEDVKHDYAGKLEEMRSTLAYSMSIKASLKEREVEALIRYFELLTELRTEKLQRDIGGFLQDHEKSIWMYRKSILRQILQIDSQYIRVEMHCYLQPTLMKAVRDTHAQLDGIRDILLRHFTRWLELIRHYKHTLITNPQDTDRIDGITQQIHDEFDSYRTERTPLVTKFDESIANLVVAIHEHLNTKVHEP